MKARLYHDTRKKFRDYIDAWSIYFPYPKWMRKENPGVYGCFISCKPTESGMIRCIVDYDAFITAYKGSGSYYTMRNLIMFHGARFVKNGRKMSEANSLKELDSKAKLYDEEGWKMLGVLKQLIKDNNISVQGKILEWKKAKSENK